MCTTWDWICVNSSFVRFPRGMERMRASSGVISALRLAQVIDEGAQSEVPNAVVAVLG